MQTTKEFSEELMNFPAAGFAVASFVNPDEPQPSSSTSPLFTPEPNAPTPSGIADQILSDESFFPEPFITPSPTFYPENDFSEDQLLGLGTRINTMDPVTTYNTPPPFFNIPYNTPPPQMETFIDISKFTKNKNPCTMITFCIIMVISLAMCYCTYTVSKTKPPVQTSSFGKVENFDDILLNIIAGN